MIHDNKRFIEIIEIKNSGIIYSNDNLKRIAYFPELKSRGR